MKYLYVAYRCAGDVTPGATYPECSTGWEQLPETEHAGILADVLTNSLGNWPGLSVSEFQQLAGPITLVFAAAWGWQQISVLIKKRRG